MGKLDSGNEVVILFHSNPGDQTQLQTAFSLYSIYYRRGKFTEAGEMYKRAQALTW
jgi:hypothetical protein